jgi:single-strand DNA-binding protein
VFSPTTRFYIAEHITKGDLVHVRGRLRQSSYERNGSRVYAVDLAASSFSRLAQGSDRAKVSEQAREAQPA